MITRSLMTALFSVALIGCGQDASTTQNPKPTTPKAKASDVAKTDEKSDAPKGEGHDHGGWWCAEHGIPEAECSMCSTKVARRCKAKGDWCHDHDRAKSQCFICDPKLKEKFAAIYRAKEGKEPPPIIEEANPAAKGDTKPAEKKA
jgi:hypothetical protein